MHFNAALNVERQVTGVKEIIVSVRLSHSHGFAFDAASKLNHGMEPSAYLFSTMPTIEKRQRRSFRENTKK